MPKFAQLSLASDCISPICKMGIKSVYFIEDTDHIIYVPDWDSHENDVKDV